MSFETDKPFNPDQTEGNDKKLLLTSSNHMSGSDIEILGTESSDSFEIINSSEHSSSSLNTRTVNDAKEVCFDVNAHGHQPTPQAKPPQMESQKITTSEDAGCTGEYKEISSDNEEDDDDVTIDDTSSGPSSPSQISPNHRIIYDDKDCNSDGPEESQDNANIERPDSLSLPRPLQYYEKQHHKNLEYTDDSCSDVSRSSSTAALIEEASKTPLTKQGTVTQEGDMIAFVADGLNDMIKMSSPISRTGK